MSRVDIHESVSAASELRFILNGQDVALHGVKANDTLLDHLRLKARLTGTKEGCAEGDCGACTVLLGRLREDVLTYQPVNACICPLAALQGCHVVTIEYLGRAENLHPVQAAMVAHHGSQCGFCTPGIVMSLYALWMETPAPTPDEVKTALQGNLCRCTGYAPILRAAMAVVGDPANDLLAVERSDVAARLRSLKLREVLDLGDAIIPSTKTELAQVLHDHPAATVVAGATDVGLWVSKKMVDIGPAVFIAGLDDLDYIVDAGARLRVGAGASYARLLSVIEEHVPQLGAYLQRIGGAQVRAMGTIGGNIANGSPIGDMAPALIPLQATVKLRSVAGLRELPLEAFFVSYGKQDLRPGEFLEEVEFLKPSEAARYGVYKLSKRRDEDISTVAAGFWLEEQNGQVAAARLAFGGMAGVPKRAHHAEGALIGKPWDEEHVRAGMVAMEADFDPLSDARGSAEYRMKAAQNMLLRFYLEQECST